MLQLYLISPKSTFPWTFKQVADIAKARQFNIVVIDKEGERIMGYTNIYGMTDTIAFVFIHQNYRCQQVGEALISHMIDICEQKN